MCTPTESKWVSNNYITRCHRRLELDSSNSSCSWSQLGTKCQRENQLAERRLAALRDPLLSSPARTRKKCSYGQKNFGSICSSLSPSPTHLSHATNINPFATLSRIKCERYIFFIKKCVRRSLKFVYYCWLSFRIYLYMYCVVLCGYTTLSRELCGGVRPPPSMCPEYDINHLLVRFKSWISEDIVYHLFPSLPGPEW